MNGCEICDNVDNCVHCVTAYYLAGENLGNSSCVPCPEGCITCDNSTMCTNCAPEFYLDTSATVPTSPATKCLRCDYPCITCKSTATECLSCHLGYYYPNDNTYTC